MALGLTPQQIVDSGEHPLLVKAAHWERVFLKEIASVQNGAAFSSSYFTDDDGLPLIRIRDVRQQETENFYNGPYSPEYIVNSGDLLIGMDGDFRCAFWTGGKALLNQRVCRVRLKSDLMEEKFLYFCLQPYLDAIHAHTSSVTVKHLSSRTVENIPLPLPPLGEQQRLVAKIEELFSELDDSVANLETARARLQAYRQSLLKHAFEGRLTEQWRRDHGDELESADHLLERIREERQARYQQQLEDWKAQVAQWEADGKPGKKPRKPAAPKESLTEVANDPMAASQFPSWWARERVGYLFEVVSGGTPKGVAQAEGKDVPYFRVGDMTSPGNERFMEAASHWVGFDEASKLGLRIFPKGTIIFPKRGGAIQTDKKRELIVDSCMDLNIMGIVNQSPEILNGFVWHWINSFRLESISDGSNVPQINNRNIEPLSFPLCSTEEQKVIVDILEFRLSQIDQMEKAIIVSHQQAESLRQSILKHAFDGRLVQQNPSDEPARDRTARTQGGAQGSYEAEETG